MKFDTEVDLPVVTSSERADYKRCPKKWFWRWRKGLVPHTRTFGALDLGMWMHEALAEYYIPGATRGGDLAVFFENNALADIQQSGAPDHALAKAEELMGLGMEMAKAYQHHYGDEKIRVLRAELPMEFTISHNGVTIAAHKLKPDLVFVDEQGFVWLMEHKTAQSIQTEHLPIDDQARPYGAMAESSLRKMGIINKRQQFRGIMYNFLRKALPDQRPRNEKGQYLNKDGSVSKKQPPAYFLRKPVTMSRNAKRTTLSRVRDEILVITEVTLSLRTKEIHPERLQKTQHKSCPKTCPFFDMCVAEENGADIRDMERLLFRRENPYLYHAESTEDPVGFEVA